MNLKIIKIIYFKELLETLRDKKTLVVMILIPIVLYPFMSVGIMKVHKVQKAKMEQKISKVVLKSNKPVYKIDKLLKTDKKIQIVECKDPMSELKDNKIQAVLELPDDFEIRIKQNKSAIVKIYYDNAEVDSKKAHDTINNLLTLFNNVIVENRLKKIGLNEEFIIPFDIKSENIATVKKMTGFTLGSVLPLMLIVMVILGAFYPAIDSTAGEKERGTLQTILTAPVKKTEIIIGKYISVSTIAVIVGTLNLGSMIITMWYALSKGPLAITFTISFSNVLLVAILMLPTALFVSAIMMSIASFVRSFKEAQNLLTPVYIVCFLPAMLPMIPGIELEGILTILPFANISLLIKELLMGKASLINILLVLISTSVYAVLSIVLAIKVFNSEKVLFSTSDSIFLFKRKK